MLGSWTEPTAPPSASSPSCSHSGRSPSAWPPSSSPATHRRAKAARPPPVRRRPSNWKRAGRFKITPAMPEVPAGPVVVRLPRTSGSQVHNLSFPALDKDSGDIQPGQTATMDLGELAAGTYDMVCTIAGHAAAGMTGMLHVGSATGGSAAAGSSAAAPTTTMDVNAMDAAMEKVAKDFPATTAGHGGDLLEPVIQADGRGVRPHRQGRRLGGRAGQGREGLDLQRSGPAPTIKVDVGDKVRVVLKNGCRSPPASTSTACGCPTPWTASTPTRSTHQARRELHVRIRPHLSRPFGITTHITTPRSRFPTGWPAPSSSATCRCRHRSPTRTSCRPSTWSSTTPARSVSRSTARASRLPSRTSSRSVESMIVNYFNEGLPPTRCTCTSPRAT